MNPIYILGAGNFAEEVYSEVFLQGNASEYGLFEGYIYISKLDNPILIDTEGNEKGFNYPKDAAFILATGVKKWRQKFIEIFSKKYQVNDKHFPNVMSESTNISPYILPPSSNTSSLILDLVISSACPSLIISTTSD